VLASQRRAVPSALALATSLPFGLNATMCTSSVCPDRLAITKAVPTFHSRTTWSLSAVTIKVPVESKAADVVVAGRQSKTRSCPVIGSHSRAESSLLVVRMNFPSELKAARFTCPAFFNSASFCPPGILDARAMPSSSTLTINFPSGLKSTLSIGSLCPSMVPTVLPVAASHSRTWPSRDRQSPPAFRPDCIGSLSNTQIACPSARRPQRYDLATQRAPTAGRCVIPRSENE